MTVFDQMLARYEQKTETDKINVLHEVMQQVALAGLNRAGFFDKAAFYGGTCLRIFYGIDRFSEDMDFSLLQVDSKFSLEYYFDALKEEFHSYGREIELVKKQKTTQSNIESAFLKDDTELYNIQFKTEKAVKIKLEVDVNPPLGFSTEHKLLLQPYSFMSRCYALPDLYAGKMHALLFRTWKNRVKGRDWYDFEWYVRRGEKLNFEHLKQRTLQQGKYSDLQFTKEFFLQLLHDKIKQTDIAQVKQDVYPFIKNTEALNIWSKEYFQELVNRIEFK